jgi:hypothetical protein
MKKKGQIHNATNILNYVDVVFLRDLDGQLLILILKHTFLIVYFLLVRLFVCLFVCLFVYLFEKLGCQCVTFLKTNRLNYDVFPWNTKHFNDFLMTKIVLGEKHPACSGSA